MDGGLEVHRRADRPIFIYAYLKSETSELVCILAMYFYKYIIPIAYTNNIL